MFEEIRNTNPDYPYIQQKISEALDKNAAPEIPVMNYQEIARRN